MAKLRNDWITILKNFNTSVHNQLAISEEDIVSAYGDLVKCEAEAECCPYDDSVVTKHLDKITANYKEIHRLELEIRSYEVKIDEIKNECPVEYATLANGGTLNDPTSVVSTDNLTAFD